MIKFWIYIWMAVVFFSLISFTLMSAKILYSGYAELKSMLSSIENDDEENKE